MDNDNLTAGSLRGGRVSGKWLALDGGAIKIIGATLMVMDHLHQMFVTQGAPAWLKWFGRPVAVMFLFLCAEGFFHTRNKKLYMLRLLGASVLMNFGNQLLSKLFYLEGVELINNIFGALFMCAFYMLMVDLFREGMGEKRPGRILLALGGILLPLIIGFALLVLLSMENLPRLVVGALLFTIPTPFTVEGGIVMVGMGVVLYMLRSRRWAQALVPVAVGLLVALASRNESGIPDSQWLMVFAALPILLYNGRRGWGAKYFFYAFYPAHIYLLYLVAWFLRSAGR
jgi:hypothetical protein